MKNIHLLMQGRLPIRLLNLVPTRKTVYHMTDARGFNKLLKLPKTAQICAFTKLNKSLYTNIGYSNTDYTYMVELTADVVFSTKGDMYTNYIDDDGSRYIDLNILGAKAKQLVALILKIVIDNIANLPTDLKSTRYNFIAPYVTDTDIANIKSKIAKINWEYELNDIVKPTGYDELIVSNTTVNTVYRTTAETTDRVEVLFPVTSRVTLDEALTLVNGAEVNSLLPSRELRLYA